MPELHSDVRYIRGIGEQRAKSLGKLGIHTLFDLVSYFPRDYEDRTVMRPIDSLLPDESACVKAMVAAEPRLHRVRRGMELVKLRAVDDTGTLDITFFNQVYVKNRLIRGETYIFYGRVQGDLLRKIMINPHFERASAAGTVTGRVMPVYRLTAGLSQKLVAAAVQSGLDACGEQLPELMPESVRRAYRLPDASFAYRNIHFPADFAALREARRRLVFEELFLLVCAMGLLREKRRREDGIAMDSVDQEAFFASLPFSPTGAQRRAVKEAMDDMRSGLVMSRLIQGDVGSGKNDDRRRLHLARREKRISVRFHGAHGDPGRAAPCHAHRLPLPSRGPGRSAHRFSDGRAEAEGQGADGERRGGLDDWHARPAQRRRLVSE